MKNLKYFAFALAAVFASCSDDDVKPVNEEEVITTVTVSLTSVEGNVVLTSRDLDGDGPNAPVITVSGPLKSATSYTGSITFQNELESPAGNITEEIAEEGADHQLFYQTIPGALADFTYLDEDGGGKPIGLNFQMSTGAAGTGSLSVTLRHEPNKNAAGVAQGDITNAGGSTDAQITYPIVVED